MANNTCVHVLHVVKEVFWSGGAVGVAVEAEATVRALLPGVIRPTMERDRQTKTESKLVRDSWFTRVNSLAYTYTVVPMYAY